MSPAEWRAQNSGSIQPRIQQCENKPFLIATVDTVATEAPTTLKFSVGIFTVIQVVVRTFPSILSVDDLY